VLLHDRDLLGRQWSRLEQHGVGHTHLAQVVQRRAAIERSEIPDVEAQRLAQRPGVGSQPLAVPVGARIAGLDGQRETENDVFGGAQLVSVPLQPEQRADPCPQFRRVERLRDEIVGPRLDSAEAILALVEPRHEDHRNEAGVVARLEDAAHLDPVAARHHHVEQRQIGVLARDQLEGVVAAGRVVYNVAVGHEQAFQQGEIGGLVVGDDDAPASRRIWRFIGHERLTHTRVPSIDPPKPRRSRPPLVAGQMEAIARAREDACRCVNARCATAWPDLCRQMARSTPLPCSAEAPAGWRRRHIAFRALPIEEDACPDVGPGPNPPTTGCASSLFDGRVWRCWRGHRSNARPRRGPM
jgi:hypothetical protein